MANNPTDESTPEELDAEAIQEGADADQTQSGAEDEAGDERQDAHDDDGKVQGDAAEELAKVKDQLLRTVAEMENVRRELSVMWKTLTSLRWKSCWANCCLSSIAWRKPKS